MKRNFVDLATHEAVEEKLKRSEAEVERLRSHLNGDGDEWEAVDHSPPLPSHSQPGLGAWASIHAPKKSTPGNGGGWDMSGERSVSFASTTGSRGKEVEVDAGGWWS